jgi:menaquinone-dependent protoporphyrinogen oxidase
MSKSVLVTFATRAGSTAEVASAIGAVLDGRGFSVELKPIKEKPEVRRYQAVILGSAIRMGNWLPEAMDFIRSNQNRLNEIPTAIFTVHLLNTGNDKTSRIARQAYTIPVRQLLAPFDEVFFNGKLDYSKLSLFDSTLAKIAETNTGFLPSDFRDWNKIRDWAQTILV